MAEFLQNLPDNLESNMAELKQFGEDMGSGKMGMTEHEGKRCPPGFLAQTVKYVRDDWEGIRENDIFIASSVKTGTHWVTEVVWRIVSANDPKLYEALCSLPMPFTALEVGPASKFPIVDALPIPRRVFMTHIAGDDFPVEKATAKGAKMIYVLRNPKDQTVSWFHFVRNHPSKGKHSELVLDKWDDFLKIYYSGAHPLNVRNDKGEWYPEHILSWYPHKKQANVRFLYYENMKKDLYGQIKSLADYLDVELSDDQARKIADDCEFKAMKAMSEKIEGGLNDFRKSLKLMRKGQVGDWKNYFTVAQSEALDEEISKKLGNTDIKFVYEL